MTANVDLIKTESVIVKVYLAVLTFTALAVWLSCGSVINSSNGAQASITRSAEAPSGFEGIAVYPPLDVNTVIPLPPAPVRRPPKFNAAPLLECREIMDTVALLTEESYDMITRAKEELSAP